MLTVLSADGALRWPAQSAEYLLPLYKQDEDLQYMIDGRFQTLKLNGF